MVVQDTRAVKVTISLQRELLEFADRKAELEDTSRSQLIGRILAQVKAQEEERLAAAGYQFYAQEAGEFAVASMPAVSEALEHER